MQLDGEAGGLTGNSAESITLLRALVDLDRADAMISRQTLIRP